MQCERRENDEGIAVQDSIRPKLQDGAHGGPGGDASGDALPPGKRFRKQWRSFSKGALKTLAPWIAAPLFYLLSRTWKVTLTGDPVGSGHVGPAPRPPCIFALWHEDDLSLGGAYAYCDVALLVSLSNDGELIARIMRLLGFECFRGSSSRGGARGLLGLIRYVREGGRACVTVDGPRGPRHEVKPGVVEIARKTGAPIVPIRAYADRAWVFGKAWSQSRIPKPFSKVTVVCDTPIFLRPAGAQRDGARESEVRQIQQSLERLDVLARENGIPGAPPAEQA